SSDLVVRLVDRVFLVVAVQEVEAPFLNGSEAPQKVSTDHKRKIRGFLPVQAVDLVSEVDPVSHISEELVTVLQVDIHSGSATLTSVHVPSDSDSREIRQTLKKGDHGLAGITHQSSPSEEPHAGTAYRGAGGLLSQSRRAPGAGRDVRARRSRARRSPNNPGRPPPRRLRA